MLRNYTHSRKIYNVQWHNKIIKRCLLFGYIFPQSYITFVYIIEFWPKPQTAKPHTEARGDKQNRLQNIRWRWRYPHFHSHSPSELPQSTPNSGFPTFLTALIPRNQKLWRRLHHPPRSTKNPPKYPFQISSNAISPKMLEVVSRIIFIKLNYPRSFP